MRAVLLWAAASLPVWGLVEGTVNNLTTGKPQPNAVVSLMNLGAGMSPAGAARTDAQGVFRIQADLQAQTPYLIQVIHSGVTYNKMVQPGAAASGIVVEVYDAAAKVPEARVSQHMVLLEPSETELVVNQTLIYTNTGKVTYNDPEGTLKIWVPDEVKGTVPVRVMAPGGMPINRQLEKSSKPNVYTLKYPVKPGETRFDVVYSLPARSGATFAGRILHSGGPVRFVAPPGVALESRALTSLGTEPQTGATVYELKGTEYALAISGTGTLQASQGNGAAQDGEAAGGGEDPSGGINIVKPRLYQRAAWVVGLGFLMLAVGFLMLYRLPGPAGSGRGEQA